MIVREPVRHVTQSGEFTYYGSRGYIHEKFMLFNNEINQGGLDYGSF
jgi:hypothetical protein